MNHYHKIIENIRIKSEINNRIKFIKLLKKESSQEGQDLFKKRFREFNNFVHYLNTKYENDYKSKEVVMKNAQKIYPIAI